MKSNKSNLSPRQVKLLQYILDFQSRRSKPPTVRDMQHAEEPPISSTSVVDYNLTKLEEQGIIRREPGLSRSIEVVEDKIDELISKRIVRRPRVLGAMLRVPLSELPIAAGTPIAVPEALDSGNVHETLEVDPRLLGRWADHPEDLFALPVKGQSMIDALIADGDIVIMAKQDTANDGETVAVWLEAEQETTLKHFWRESEGRVRLQPANTSMAPIMTTADNVKIMGRVVSVLRRCD